ncbi:hypothetical protein A1507_19520 [Methylomonas koyamae]|uniref:Uncharacterized protein n=1 Tax=Methylomonas koyamae TaxID=702114 RepID=A0A177N1Q4_9GAMM|nr:hypothetical protein A1507_19520 [Methylomonas koyamae]
MRKKGYWREWRSSANSVVLRFGVLAQFANQPIQLGRSWHVFEAGIQLPEPVKGLLNFLGFFRKALGQFGELTDSINQAADVGDFVGDQIGQKVLNLVFAGLLEVALGIVREAKQEIRTHPVV